MPLHPSHHLRPEPYPDPYAAQGHPHLYARILAAENQFPAGHQNSLWVVLWCVCVCVLWCVCVCVHDKVMIRD